MRLHPPRGRRLLTAAGCLLSAPAAAHTTITPYDLPIPFSVYVYAVVGTLVLTFVVLLFVPVGRARAAPTRHGCGLRLPEPLVLALRTATLALLAVAVLAGLIGTPSPVANIAPFLIWILLMLGLTGFTALGGDVFAVANPWRSLARLCSIGCRPICAYPAALAYWPAFVCYLGLAWLELMAPPLPSLLAWALLGYTLVTLAGAALFGRRAWFERAELFGLFFRLVGTMAPVAFVRDAAGWRACRRPGLSGMTEAPPGHLSLVLFILFMLAATTYDGVWQTSFWAGLYWGNLMHWLQPLWGDDMARAQALLAPGYALYQRGGLIAAPFVYLAAYMLVVLAMRAATGRRAGILDLAGRFAPSLVPIAVAYMFAHNWTSILSTIPVVPFLLSDPFGIGWNLLGLPFMSAEPAPLDMGQVWHIEVGLILAGHVTSVYASHIVALHNFDSRRTVWWSEGPLLVLMVGYTFIGLVVLSLPLALH